jgi:hypothetical protein
MIRTRGENDTGRGQAGCAKWVRPEWFVSPAQGSLARTSFIGTFNASRPSAP